MKKNQIAHLIGSWWLARDAYDMHGQKWVLEQFKEVVDLEYHNKIMFKIAWIDFYIGMNEEEMPQKQSSEISHGDESLPYQDEYRSM